MKSSLHDLQDQHKELRRPSGFGFAFADRVDYLDPVRWDAVTARSSVFLGRDVLRVIETDGPKNIEPRYALIFRDGEPVAALAAQIVTVSGDQLTRQQDGESVSSSKSRALLKRALAPAKKIAETKFRQWMLVTGNLLSWGFHGVAFAPDADASSIWSAIAEALYRIRRAERLTGQTNLVMVKDCGAEQPGVEAMRRYRYTPVETEPNMVLQIEPDWRNYEDYLSALAAKYRRNSKDQIKKLNSSGCTVERLDDVAGHAARLHELYLSVHRNAAVRMVMLPAGYLPALARATGANFRCNVIRRGEEILGFVTTLRDGDTAIAYYIGFDRAAADEGLPVYLRLLHTTIADAIDWGCQRLSLGRTALEPKAAIGAKPEPVAVWLRHRVAALNWALQGVLGGRSLTLKLRSVTRLSPHNPAPGNSRTTASGTRPFRGSARPHL